MSEPSYDAPDVDELDIAMRPICEKCWIVEHGHWDPVSVSEQGVLRFSVNGFTAPPDSWIRPSTVEICGSCGQYTIWGVWTPFVSVDAQIDSSSA